MRHFAVYLSVALVATSALGHATEAGGPSFDCAKAATPIEQAICADSTLSALDNTLAGLLKETLAREPAYREAILSDQRGWLARRDLTHSWIWSVSSSLEEIYKKRISQLQVLEDLDKTLAGILKETLARDPARREAILSEQRHWIAERDRTCRSQADSVSACLKELYQAGIQQLQILPSSDVTGVCKKIKKAAELYLARPKPAADCHDKKCFYAPSPLDALAGTPGSGVTKEKHAAELRNGTFSELADWASRAPQSFTLSDEVMQALKDKGVGDYVDRLPDSNFFAVSGVSGTAQCISSGYFSVENGRAHTADGPKNWDEDACFGGTRWFGTVDRTPVAFQDDHTYYVPQITSSLSVAPG